MKAVHVEQLKPEWIAEVAQIHMDALPNDFLPGLGFNFLNTVFYPGVLKSNHAKTFIAVADNQPLGFVIVAQNSARLFSEIVRDNLWEFVKIGLLTSLSSFAQFRKNVQILFSSLKKDAASQYGEIYEIAVRPDNQGRGMGKMLVQASQDYLKHEGLPGISIKTRRDNTAWIQFFLHQGWQLSHEVNLIGNQYVILVSAF
ncbi:GNAT family N-acetyltransferase [Pelolinea submarina]|uniref:Acetyltransferase (GNAT) family protein n=1 Tax=Pelolinea submarina TaxID=913107 RepID=A0A347ZVZ8_9CHLR|nr:GNAT family N-acetyltransferase [Pelolinea submarina]REG07175.1 acetyltransferase (GNAT) family protein [Pelolinea submarina]BBB49479.1 mycothiol synthase [Pelolinea submarina]